MEVSITKPVISIPAVRARQETEKDNMSFLLSADQKLDELDPSLANHRHRTADRAVALAGLLGCSQEDVKTCFWAGLLHDIGKIIVPPEILLKPGGLEEKEWRIMRQHPFAGGEIVQPIEWLTPVAEVVRCHHEHYDGHGYPFGLKGDKIPHLARILAVVDAFSAMVDGRIYRSVLSTSQAVGELLRNRGTQFDPEVVDGFVRLSANRDLTYHRPNPSFGLSFN